MKNEKSLSLNLRRVRTTLRTNVNTGPSCGSGTKIQAKKGYGYEGMAQPPGGGGGVAQAYKSTPIA